MKLYSTNNDNSFVSFKEAVQKGLPVDNGLFMPAYIPTLPDRFFKNLKSYTFQEIAFEVSNSFIGDEIPKNQLESIIHESINFPAPLIQLDDRQYILELFHGPTLAFKDFGARFMAQLLSYYNQDEESDLVILVATSGDTGGAVASGFLNTPHIKVVVLYPSGQVSPLQEKQLTTLGKNIIALEVKGNFDDCQAMVKQAFLDIELNSQIRLSSANSINIARLLPQTFYYFEGFKQLIHYNLPVIFSVPSGNFGNLTAGLLAKKMGLPVSGFIAATNANDVFIKYLQTSEFLPKASVRTISNAMDVGNPSNFYRILDLFHPNRQPANITGSTWNNIKDYIKGYSFNDYETTQGIKEIYESYNYIIDPHGSVGYLALKSYQTKYPNSRGIILETAHPSKFFEHVEEVLKISVTMPEQISNLANNRKCSHIISKDYIELKKHLLKTL